MTTPTLNYAQQRWQLGDRLIAGVDEVGRGAWAGPVVTAAAILPSDCQLPLLLRDSKLLSASQRQSVAGQIEAMAVDWAIGQASVEEIDQMGIIAATFLAMQRSLDSLRHQPDFVLIDGFCHPNIDPGRQLAIIKGDQVSASIAAASVLAKIFRDDLMARAEDKAGYGFARHKGYGTAQHRQAIHRLGLSPFHRHSFQLPAATPISTSSL
jgi:ribonuclease HII